MARPRSPDRKRSLGIAYVEYDNHQRTKYGQGYGDRLRSRQTRCAQLNVNAGWYIVPHMPAAARCTDFDPPKITSRRDYLYALRSIVSCWITVRRQYE